ncbi:ATP-dependent helicase [Polynucleobacter sp. P1-05-14]|uniref:ATP-dependent helicase n=1 Tax=Polynucleobacter sp. P1-05-14 TaxID=1819732 RepID=UPI001C20D6E9|nr:ATP-dependent helicase [Polynucleobacter sp. P1-05-14]MBU3548094.1 ATP-dependent helicase [Polynucleobacter sp. P1-05-14]
MLPSKIRLSDQQLSVVNYVDGPLLVVAGPGSGKTRVLTERIRSLLSSVPGHFRILALTFTNKAADEMRERLIDLGDMRQRAFIGTMHSFCLEILTERGGLVGVDGLPNIFEQYKDRKEILLNAVMDDPMLEEELNQEGDAKARGRKIDLWLQRISWIKAHPISCAVVDDDVERRVLEAYDNGLRASNAYDFDDLLILVCRLFGDHPRLAEFYQRLYRFICIDEAQDLNEAQYAVICALCGDVFRNVMMVGDPKQSIYGFNTSSPEYMTRFKSEFHAKQIELTENFRSSRAVVGVARALDSNYLVAAQLPVEGLVEVIEGDDEENEAKRIVDQMQHLFNSGHLDIEGDIDSSRCAILGRTRFVLLAVEKELRCRGIPFYKRLTANHENESELVDDFQLALRVLANPRDRLHFSALVKKWKAEASLLTGDAIETLNKMTLSADVLLRDRADAVVTAINSILRNPQRLDLMPAFGILKEYADGLDEGEKLAIYEDLEVFRQEWDQYLRSNSSVQTIAGFMVNKALGATQKSHGDGVALLTVHSSKGLEFDVVFVAGMAEGSFPDYRSTSGRALLEERRNAFVALTRSKRLLYLTYPKLRVMPWGGIRTQYPSRFIEEMGLIE